MHQVLIFCTKYDPKPAIFSGFSSHLNSLGNSQSIWPSLQSPGDLRQTLIHFCSLLQLTTSSTSCSFLVLNLNGYKHAARTRQWDALEGVDKEQRGLGQPTYREDEKARRNLTLARTLYHNRITVYIWYIYTKLPYPYI